MVAVTGPGALNNIRVLDLSTVIAGPGCARYLADFGADVIKVERAGVGDTARNMGWKDETDGETFFFKNTNRNKRFIELDLRAAEDKEKLLKLVETSQILVENMRPGKMEKLGLGPDDLLARNPKLIMVRVTAFGQTGPYKDRPGFATLAEAMSGFASINGAEGGAPTLPPIALTDEVTALAGAFAAMVALHSGVGQVVDLSLIESLNQMMGPLPTLWMRNGELQPRLGSGLPYSIPRGTYETKDGKWVAVSTSADTVAARVMTLIGLGGDERVATVADRMVNRDLVEDRMVAWTLERSLEDVLNEFQAADAAAAQVYDMEDLCADPHAQARDMFVEVDGYPMSGVVAKLSETPGQVRWAAKALGADNDLLDELD